MLGTLQPFIGWEITNTKNGLYLGKEKYVQKMLSVHNLENTSHISPPLP